MSKMGIAVISSYRGGSNFEALGLSRTLVAEYFPNMPSRISGIGMPGIQKRDQRAARARLEPRRHRAADRRFLQIPRGRRDACLGRRSPSTRCRRPSRHDSRTRPFEPLSRRRRELPPVAICAT